MRRRDLLLTAWLFHGFPTPVSAQHLKGLHVSVLTPISSVQQHPQITLQNWQSWVSWRTHLSYHVFSARRHSSASALAVELLRQSLMSSLRLVQARSGRLALPPAPSHRDVLRGRGPCRSRVVSELCPSCGNITEWFC
jgi:hypothetical protein